MTKWTGVTLIMYYHKCFKNMKNNYPNLRNWSLFVRIDGKLHQLQFLKVFWLLHNGRLLLRHDKNTTYVWPWLLLSTIWDCTGTKIYRNVMHWILSRTRSVVSLTTFIMNFYLSRIILLFKYTLVFWQFPNTMTIT